MSDKINKEGVIRIAADQAAKTAVELWETKRREEREKNEKVVLMNTKLLLSKYRAFKATAEQAVYEAGHIDETAFDILELMMQSQNIDVTIESIQRSAIRTAIIVEHINKMLAVYRVMCNASDRPEEKRNYSIIHDFYIRDKPLDYQQIARKYHLSKSGVYASRESAIATISVLIFGIDGMRFKSAEDVEAFEDGLPDN